LIFATFYTILMVANCSSG